MKATPIFLALLNVLTCFVVFYSVELYYSVVDYTYYIVPLKDEGGSWIDLFQTSCGYFFIIYLKKIVGFGSKLVFIVICFNGITSLREIRCSFGSLGWRAPNVKSLNFLRIVKFLRCYTLSNVLPLTGFVLL